MRIENQEFKENRSESAKFAIKWAGLIIALGLSILGVLIAFNII
jgi:hypothetical protein